ncbi:hypothetical protein [Salmonirosea aquatica]|uniref:Uncharacterized protein n=1 Tax=Salmonirosea aquatica TaxID=2654236 RepID=A0A7C9FCY0_9BACT|nr:hypothetical protein [Cytophagaceae bacterium SJW1-29]
MGKFISSLLGVVCLIASAQAQFMQDINGRVVSEVTYTNVEGSPYLMEEANTGIVRMAKDDKVYDGLKLRYDAYKDEVEYEKDGKLYRLGPEISSFSLATGDALYEFRRGFPAVGDQTENSFYRVLTDGNTKLLKRYEMKMREEKPYNSATVTKRFDLDEQLYVLKKGTLYPVKTGDRKGIMKLVSDEKNLMNYVIKEEQLNFKTEDDIAKLLEEYDAYKAGRKGDN